MAETPGVSGLSNAFGYYSEVGDYQQRGKSKSSAVNLKMGETLLSEILQTFEDKLASVRLPIGVMNAYLEGDLQAGDRLFLQVAQLKPYLVLKIHSVPVILQNKELSEKEILRLLNVPIAKLSLNLVNYLKRYHSVIKRDDVFELVSIISKMPKNDLRQYSMWQILSLAYFFFETKIAFSQNLYNKLKQLYLSYDELFNAVLNLLASEEATNILEKFIDAKLSIDEKVVRFISLLNMFVAKPESEEAEFIRLLNFYLFNSDVSMAVKENLKQVLGFAESFYLYALISFMQNNVIVLFFPYFRNQRYYLGKMLYKKKLKRLGRDIFEFLLIFSMENSEEIQVFCKVHNDVLDVEFFIKDKVGIELLKLNEQNLVEKLRDLGYKVSKINYNYQGVKIGMGQNILGKGEDKGLSVVV